jgi:hypothetical protein
MPSPVKKPASSPRGPGKREVRNLLAALSKEELIGEMMRMYDDFAPVREYLAMRISPDDSAVRDKYKRIVEKEFSSWTRGPRLSVARKAVQDYRKVAASAEGIADMMLYYVERAASQALDVGADERTLSSLLTMYRDAIDHILKHDLRGQFLERSRRVAQSDLGYGISDAMMDFHCIHLENERPGDGE